MEKPDFSWENLKVGMIIGERDIILTQDSLSNYCDSLGIQETFYSTDSPYQNPIAPPMIFVNDLLAIYDENFKRFGTIHASLSYNFYAPIFLNKTYHQKVTVRELFIKRQKGWIVSELLVSNNEEKKVVRSLHTSVLSLTREHQSN
jgi:acyl dehydratase